MKLVVQSTGLVFPCKLRREIYVYERSTDYNPYVTGPRKTTLMEQTD